MGCSANVFQCLLWTRHSAGQAVGSKTTVVPALRDVRFTQDTVRGHRSQSEDFSMPSSFSRKPKKVLAPFILHILGIWWLLVAPSSLPPSAYGALHLWVTGFLPSFSIGFKLVPQRSHPWPHSPIVSFHNTLFLSWLIWHGNGTIAIFLFIDLFAYYLSPLWNLLCLIHYYICHAHHLATHG